MSGLLPMMGAPQQIQGGLLGAAQNYGYPLTSGLLSHIGNAGGVGPWAQTQAGPQASRDVPDYTQEALELAGNPHAGPYANAASIGASLPPVAGSPGTSGSSGGGSAGSSTMGLLAALAKNPSLVKNGVNAAQGLLGNSLASYGSGAAADGAVTGALGNVGAQTAPEAASVQAGNDAALAASDGGSAGAGAGLLSMGGLGSGLAADSAVTGALGTVGAQTAGEAAAIEAANTAALGGSAAAGGTAAGAGGGAAAGGAGGTAAGGAALGAAGALGLAALPLALAAFVPYNSGFSGGEVQGMLNDISAATKTNGGLLNAGSGISDGSVSNPQLATGFQDLMTLLGTNPEEFSKSGGTGPIDQQLTAMGYGGLLGGGAPITTPLKGSKTGWLGGGYTGKSRA